MTSAVVCFRLLAHNNAWANHRLLKACLTLDGTAFAKKRTSFFPSLQETLNHMLVVDWFYVDALEGGNLGPAAWADEVPFPHCGDLAQAQAAVDRRLVNLCNALQDATLSADVRMQRTNHVQVDRTDRTLLHLFQHQIHHRGQAHAMLAGTSVAPPQLDEFFMTGDRDLRSPDFSELGWAEEEVWRGL